MVWLIAQHFPATAIFLCIIVADPTGDIPAFPHAACRNLIFISDDGERKKPPILNSPNRFVNVCIKIADYREFHCISKSYKSCPAAIIFYLN